MANTWNIKKGTLTVSGLPITGSGEGDFIDIDFNKDFNDTVVGADGETCINEYNDKSGKATIKLMQTSGTHNILLAVEAANKQFDFSYKTPTGETWTGSGCKFKKIPALKGADKVGTYEWEVVISSLSCTSTASQAAGLLSGAVDALLGAII